MRQHPACPLKIKCRAPDPKMRNIRQTEEFTAGCVRCTLPGDREAGNGGELVRVSGRGNTLCSLGGRPRRGEGVSNARVSRPPLHKNVQNEKAQDVKSSQEAALSDSQRPSRFWAVRKSKSQSACPPRSAWRIYGNRDFTTYGWLQLLTSQHLIPPGRFPWRAV
jgi:hypothetical protein